MTTRLPATRTGGSSTPRAWLKLALAIPRFLVLTPSCNAVERITLDAAWLRLFSIIRMTVFRRRDGFKWPYRYRRAAALRRVRPFLPEWLWYRGLVLPLCAAELARLTARNVQRYGAELQAECGMSLRAQRADVLAMCLTHPGTFPTEYYVFGMHEPAAAAEASSFANGYEVEAMIASRQRAGQLLVSSGFTSEGVELLNNKERFRELCVSEGLAVSEACAVFDGGQVRWTGAPHLPRRDLFVKPVYGGGGYGAARAFFDGETGTYRLEQPKVSVTAPYPSEPLSEEGFVAWMTETGRRIGFVVEPRLAAHPDLTAVVGSATLPTLRVVTGLDDTGTCEVLYMYLRTATTDSPVDNVSAGGLAALVDPQTGRLGQGATALGQAVDRHPLTGRPMSGVLMPFAARVRENCVAVHRAVARDQPLLVPVLGWDVAVTVDGPVFLEGNPLSDLGMSQKLDGRGAWTNAAFRRSILSHLKSVEGTRVSLDPGDPTAAATSPATR